MPHVYRPSIASNGANYVPGVFRLKSFDPRRYVDSLKNLTNEQRMAVFGEIMCGFCAGCGSDDPDCPCRYDD